MSNAFAPNLSVTATEAVDILAGRRGQFVSASWTTTPGLAAANRDRVVRKHVKIVSRTGVEYANLAAHEGAETGALPWGEWALYPYIVKHKDREYLRFQGVVSVGTTWEIDGQPATRDEALALFTPSARAKANSSVGTGTMTLALENLETLRGVDMI